MKKNKYNPIHLLSELVRISPREEYTRLSKERILASSQEIETPTLMSTPSSLFLSKPLNSVSFALVGILLIVGVYYATQQLSPLFLPGLNQQNIIAEAEMVESHINIQLSQLNYFEMTSQESNTLLQEASENNLDHLNVSIITQENQKIVEDHSLQTSSASTLEVNDILKELSQ